MAVLHLSLQLTFVFQISYDFLITVLQVSYKSSSFLQVVLQVSTSTFLQIFTADLSYNSFIIYNFFSNFLKFLLQILKICLQFSYNFLTFFLQFLQIFLQFFYNFLHFLFKFFELSYSFPTIFFQFS